MECEVAESTPPLVDHTGPPMVRVRAGVTWGLEEGVGVGIGVGAVGKARVHALWPNR